MLNVCDYFHFSAEGNDKNSARNHMVNPHIPAPMRLESPLAEEIELFDHRGRIGWGDLPRSDRCPGVAVEAHTHTYWVALEWAVISDVDVCPFYLSLRGLSFVSIKMMDNCKRNGNKGQHGGRRGWREQKSERNEKECESYMTSHSVGPKD